MSENSGIEWCHHTFNPWWGCTKVSEGCRNCYADTWSRRTGHDVWGPDADRRFFTDKHWNEPKKWDRKAAEAGERHRVFCGSMCDVFEERDDLEEHRERLFDLIRETASLDWLLLTKRPENIGHLGMTETALNDPLPNVWLGTSVEDQQTADERIPHLLRCPAAVRFLSCEPLLDGVKIMQIRDRSALYFPLAGEVTGEGRNEAIPIPDGGGGVSWVIVGGESGPGARPFDLAWARDLIRQCRGAGVACFTKQLGAKPVSGDYEIRLRDKKGGDPSEWPGGLAVREFPEHTEEATP